MLARAFAALVLFAATGASAAELRTFVDSDNNASTGCTVTLASGGTFTGVERRYVTSIDTTQDPPRVTGITREDCATPPSTFSAPVSASAGGWNVGVGNGVNGYNVIESGLPLPPGVGPVRMAVEYVDAAIGSDAVTVASGGGPILVPRALADPATPIPTLSDAMLLVLVLLVGAVGWRFGRHRLAAAPLAVIALVLATSLAWAAIVLDGLTPDWAGLPQLATDPVDAPNGADISAVFGVIEGSNLFVRVDARTGMPAAAVADTYTATAGTTLTVPAATGVLANDKVGVPVATVVAFGGGSLGGAVTANAAGATATFGAGGSLTVNADGSFAFTPATGFSGAFTFSYRLVNINASVDALVTITTRAAPAITSANAASFNVGTAGTFTVVATGAPTPTLAISGALPAGVTFAAATGILSGTPGAGTAGTYPLTITASNGVLPNATQSFTLTITDGVGISSANAATFTVGTAGTFTVTTTGTPVAATIGQTGALPPGVTFTNNGNGTATIAGTPAALSGGAYPIVITASNGVGSPATQSFTLTVNQLPAFTSAASAAFVIASPGSHTVVATGFPAPTYSVSGALPSGVTFTAATGVLSGTPAAGTAGTYPLTFTATNAAGAPTQSFTLTVNQGVAITSAATATFIAGTAGTFTVTTTSTPVASTITFTGALPTGVTFTNNANGTATIAGTPGALTGGTYPIVITASNGGVTANGTQNFTLTVNQAPAFTSGTAATFVVGTAGTFTVAGTGFPAPTFAVTTGTLPSGVTLAANGTLSGTPGAGTGGAYPVTITAFNGVAPNATQAFTLTVNQPPVFTGGTATSFTAGVPGTFTFTTTGTPTAATLGEVGALPAGITFVNNGDGTATLSGTPGAATGGTYTITVSASNGVGAPVTRSFTITVNQAASFTSGAAATFLVGTAGTHTVTTTGGFPAPVLSVTGALPSGVTFTPATGVLSGTPAAGTAGSYPLTFTATNAAGGPTQSFVLTVNQGVAITSAAATTFATGTAGTFTITTTATPVAGTITFTGSLPAGVSFTNNGNGTATIAGTPGAATGGAYPLVITASNGGVSPNGTQNFTLTVLQPPAFTSGNAAAFAVGANGTFNVTATGFPAPTFSVTVGALPANVTLTSGGLLSGTPAAGTTGTYPITITATNLSANVTQAFTFTVNNAAAGIDDGYSVTHDTTLTVPAGTGLLANDTGTPAPTIASVTSTAGTCAAFPCAITTANGAGSVAADGSFTFTPAANFVGSNTFTYVATNLAGSDPATVTITVTNVAPVVDLNGPAAGIDTAATFTEGGGAVAIVDPAQLTIVDTDDTQLTGATVVITNVLDVGQETLSVTCTVLAPGCEGGINLANITYTPATGTLEILATASLADFQALLRTLKYSNAAAAPNTTLRDVTVTVNDGNVDNLPVAHARVTVVGVNGAPSITAPASATTGVNTARVFAGTVSVADPDAGTSNVQVKLTATNGKATLSGTAGLTVVGNGTASLTSTGPLTSQNAALNGMSFTPDAAYAGPATLKVDIDDLGNTGTGGPLTATRTINITVDDIPTVVSTVPANAAGNVASTSTITVTFSESVTATTSSFLLECPVGTPLTYGLSASPATVYTLTPSVPLPAGAACRVTVVAAQVTDSGGQNPAANTVVNFGTNTRPTVVSTTPANAATGVAPNATISITFSESVAAALGAFQLQCPAGSPRTFIPSSSPATTYTLTPDSNLPAGTVCQMTVVAASVTDVDAGQAMSANFVFTFTIGVPPAITSANTASFTIGSAGTHTVATTGTPTVNSILMASVTPGPGGTLPSGVAFNYAAGSTATLSGTPNNAAHVGTYVVSFTASNGVPPSAVQSPFTLTVACPTITLGPAAGSTFTASYNTAFSQAFAPSGGTAPYTYNLTGAALPSVAFSGNNLAGTPSNTGSFAFNVQAVDNFGCTSGIQAYTLNVNPTAAADNFTPTTPLIGNVRADSSLVPFSVTTNDSFPAGATITAFDATTTLGGTVVSMTASGAGIGQFVYDPPRGVTGTDTFTYTVTSNGRTAVGTVSITIANMIWFVDSAAGACAAAPCDGRSGRPYTTLAAFAAANTGAVPAPQPNAAIFIATGSGNYTGPLTLRNGQALFGQGASAATTLATLTGFTPGPGQVLPTMNGAAARPTMTASSAGANTVTLAVNNTLRGFNLQSAAVGGTALAGTSFGTLSVSEVSIASGVRALALDTGTANGTFDSVVSTSGTNNVLFAALAGNLTITAGTLAGNSGAAFQVTGGTATVSYGGTINAASPGRSVNVASKTGGTLTFSGTVTDTGLGVSLTSNTGATIAFTGGLSLSTGANPAFTATGGGTVTATQDNTGIVNTLTTTTGTALNVANTTIGAADLTFRSISSNGAASGIVLNNTGTAGSLVVSGNGGACTQATPTCTGGTIQASTGDGLSLASTANVTLGRMRILNNLGNGIRGNLLNGFVLDNSLVSGNGDNAASDESGINLTELTGSAIGGANPTSITNTVVRNNFEFEVQVTNTSGTLTDLQMTGNTISSDGLSGVHGNLVNFLALGSASMKLTSTGGTFTGATPNTASGIQCDHSGTSGLVNCAISNGTFTNNNVAVSVSQANGGSLKYNVANNTATGNTSHGLNLFVNASATGSSDGSFTNNVVGSSGVAGSGSVNGFGIRVQNESLSTASPVNVLISGNTVQQTANFSSVNVNQGIAGQASSKPTNVTITNNTLRNSAARAIVVQQNNNTSGTSAGTTCANVQGNEMNTIFGQAGDGTKIRLRKLDANGGVFLVTQGPDAAGLAALNSPPTGASATTTTAGQVSVGGTPTFSQAACTLPAP